MTIIPRVFLLAAALGVAIPDSISQAESSSLDQLYRELANSREIQISHLRSYAARKVFPRNTDFPGQLVPYFVDKAGTACAVGHLMLLDGEESLVARIASSNNHVRIEDLHGGPVLDWIRNSGLTKDECALIQPSYATIEDYRGGREWKDEAARLQKHFAKVEQTLITQTQQSLRQALIAKVDTQLAKNTGDPALAIDALSDSLRSKEPNVRIASAYALAHLSGLSKSARLEVLKPNLSDSNLEVRFWTAVAIEEIGAVSERGKLELHSLTLPIFLDAARSGKNGLRLAALVQLANIAPKTMGTHRQLRIMPEIRRTMVEACEDQSLEIRQFADTVLQSWRWQRVVYESQRILRQYLAKSADLEARAAEAMAIGRKFAEQPESIESVVEVQSLYDTANCITYMPPVSSKTALPIADSVDEARQVVDEHFDSVYGKYREQIESEWPFWRIVSVDTDGQGLYYVVVAERKDINPSTKFIYFVPRPSMLSRASSVPYYWFDIGPALPPGAVGNSKVQYQPNAESDVVLGKVARDDKSAFSVACDVFAYFLTSSSRLVIDRTILASPDKFVWTGRIAMLRANSPRFFGEGVGSSTFSGGGWDFHQLSFSCNRKTGQLTFSSEPIEFPLVQMPTSVLSPPWVTQERRLMGWKPLETIDFFEDALFPREYHEAIEVFNPDNAAEARNLLYRRYTSERSLPHPGLILGLLYERAGQRDRAVSQMKQAAGSERHDPYTLTDVARWELGIGLYGDARKHIEAAIAIWPEYPAAKRLLHQLDETGASQTAE